MNSTDLLKMVYLRLTEAGTEHSISLRADLVAVVRENGRGTTDVVTELKENDGASLTYVVSEGRDEIFEAIAGGLKYEQDRSKDRK